MELEQVGATLRAYVAASGALQAVAAVTDGIVTCDALGTVVVQLDPDDEPAPLDVGDAQPVPIGMELKQLPPFAVDAAAGEVSGPLGGLEHVAEGLLALSRALGPPSVAFTWPPTTDETPLVLSAREGDGVVIVIGEEQYEMDESWPPRPQPPRPAS